MALRNLAQAGSGNAALCCGLSLATLACGTDAPEAAPQDTTEHVADESPHARIWDDVEGPFTQRNWSVRTAPRGPHEIWTDDCEFDTISQEHQVIPLMLCSPIGGFGAGVIHPNTLLECNTFPGCENSSDCQEQPRGRCRGRTRSNCIYPSLLPEECLVDTDCTSLPDGVCASGEGHGGIPHGVCEKDGTCRASGAFCYYPEVPCTTHEECGEEGSCLHEIRSTGCEYDWCEADADCPSGARCDCTRCVEAECHSDSECESGETCELSQNCTASFEPGYHCTTPDDECLPTDDYCFYDDGRWRHALCR